MTSIEPSSFPIHSLAAEEKSIKSVIKTDAKFCDERKLEPAAGDAQDVVFNGCMPFT